MLLVAVYHSIHFSSYWNVVSCLLVRADGMSGVGQLLLENERTKQKLRKVQQRRDFYAKQYFQTLQQLDHVRAELARAMNTIKELRGRGEC